MKRLWGMQRLIAQSDKVKVGQIETQRTDSAWEQLFVVDITLRPRHEVFNVLWCSHLRWTLEVFRVLPEILEPVG